MRPIHETVSGPEALRYLEQACFVLESTLAQVAGSYENLPPHVQRLITGNLKIVAGVTNYLARNVLPTLLTDPLSQDVFQDPAAQTLIAQLVRQVDELRLRLTTPGGVLN